MTKDPAAEKPLAWSDPDFSLLPFDLLYFPGGHEKSMKQIIDSKPLHEHIAEYFPQTRKPSRKTVAAICHGVQTVSAACLPDGRSVLHDVTTTALPGAMESSIYWLTRPFLGDYYKTYGKGSENVETIVGPCTYELLIIRHICTNFVAQVKKRLNDPKQFINKLGPSPCVSISHPEMLSFCENVSALIVSQIYSRRREVQLH